jgi:hypothetical protein
LYCNKEILNIHHKFCSYKCNNNSEETKNKFRNCYNKLTDKEKDERNNKRTKTVNEKYGGYTLQSNILKKKMEKTMFELYGVAHSSQLEIFNQKRINTWIKQYGVDNPSKCEEIKNKIKRVLFERYGVENAFLINGVPEKAIQGKIKNGWIIPDCFLNDYQIYRKKVKNLTEKNYKKYKHIVNPQNFERITNGKIGYQLDHKFSVLEGFLNNIEIEIIAHPSNFEMLLWKANRNKGKSISITKEQLIKEIKEFNY